MGKNWERAWRATKMFISFDLLIPALEILFQGKYPKEWRYYLYYIIHQKIIFNILSLQKSKCLLEKWVNKTTIYKLDPGDTAIQNAGRPLSNITKPP